MPKTGGSPTAVVVSGGKQYRVAAGDRILVDRLKDEPGAELQFDRVLMVADGDALKVGAEAAGEVVTATVLQHKRGPKIDVLRYKSKKRVRVHRGARADLTTLEIISVGKGTGKTTDKTTAEADAKLSASVAEEAPAPTKPTARRPRAKKAAQEDIE